MMSEPLSASAGLARVHDCLDGLTLERRPFLTERA